MSMRGFRFAGAARTGGMSSSDSDSLRFFGGGGALKVLTLPATESGLKGLKGFIERRNGVRTASHKRESSMWFAARQSRNVEEGAVNAPRERASASARGNYILSR